jgi:hypothetical protein
MWTQLIAHDSCPWQYAGPDVYPFSALGKIRMNNGGWCTGALISEDTVLTAAHCVYDLATRRYISIAGEDALPLAGKARPNPCLARAGSTAGITR